MQPFAGRVALITGAASGIGRRLALDLAAEGAAIAALDLQPAGLESLAAELTARGHRCATAVADVTDAAALAAAAARLESELGPTDLLIASAGIGRETSGLSYSAAEVAAHIGVNLVGVSNSIAAVLPGMLARRRGHLVALSSLASYCGIPKMAAYCASKAGVNALLDALRVELKPHGIACTTVCPGWIDTPMTANVSVSGVRMMTLDFAAARIMAAIRARRSFAPIGGSVVWQVRLLRALPRPAADWLIGRLVRRANLSVRPGDA